MENGSRISSTSACVNVRSIFSSRASARPPPSQRSLNAARPWTIFQITHLGASVFIGIEINEIQLLAFTLGILVLANRGGWMKKFDEKNVERIRWLGWWNYASCRLTLFSWWSEITCKIQHKEVGREVLFKCIPYLGISCYFVYKLRVIICFV